MLHFLEQDRIADKCRYRHIAAIHHKSGLLEETGHNLFFYNNY
jgi:hypothetical protein